MSAPDPIGDAIRSSGLVGAGDRGLVLVSGGADSMSLLAGLARVLGPSSLVALHVNYGLREEAGSDETLVRDFCADAGIELVVRAAGPPEGNLQAWAREIRLGAAEQVRRERDLAWIAVGHTLDDQAETFLYRLASSPGARSLLAMPDRSGNVIRPLLGLRRSAVRRSAEEAGIPFADDVTNGDPAFARNRIRLEAMPVLESINPAAVPNLTRTRAELEEDEEFLAARAAESIGSVDPVRGLEADRLSDLHPALLRRVLRDLAEEALARPVAVNWETAAAVARLAARPEGGAVDLGSGDRIAIESGRVFVRGAGGEPPSPGPVRLEEGTVRFGEWAIRLEPVEAEEARASFGAPMTAFLGSRELDGLAVTARGRRSGDRIHQLGLGGSKSLQDAFTEARVPRSRRASWPVVEVAGEVVWVPGVAVSDRFLVGDDDSRAVRLRAEPPPAP